MNAPPRTVWVAGAAGFIGSAVARRFAAAGWRVVALAHRRAPAPGALPAGAPVETVDAADGAALAALAARLGRPEVVVNAAGLASDVGPRALFRRLNVGIPLALAAVPARKLVHVSSSDVYGIRDFRGEGEDELPFDDNVGNPYPATKIEAERRLAAEVAPERFVCLRPCAVWGEGDRTLEPRAAAFLRVSPLIVHFGPHRGRNRWPLCDVRLVAEAALAAALSPCWDGRGVTVIDHARTSIDGWYRDVAARRFPGRRYRTLCLPRAAGFALGAVSSGLSNLLRRTRPVFDPTFYSAHHVTSDLDFSDARLLAGLAATRALRNPVRTPLAPRRPDTGIAPPAVLS